MDPVRRSRPATILLPKGRSTAQSSKKKFAAFRALTRALRLFSDPVFSFNSRSAPNLLVIFRSSLRVPDKITNPKTQTSNITIMTYLIENVMKWNRGYTPYFKWATSLRFLWRSMNHHPKSMSTNTPVCYLPIL